MIPSLVKENNQTIIHWFQSTVSSLETDDKLLMIGLFCMTNYNEVKKKKSEQSDFFSLLFSH
jgi:hypothetical protein